MLPYFASAMQVLAYNRQLREMCSAEGLPFFDTVPITRDAVSFDGLHYGLDINVLKAELLLNHMASHRLVASAAALSHALASAGASAA